MFGLANLACLFTVCLGLDAIIRSAWNIAFTSLIFLFAFRRRPYICTRCPGCRFNAFTTWTILIPTPMSIRGTAVPTIKIASRIIVVVITIAILKEMWSTKSRWSSRTRWTRWSSRKRWTRRTSRTRSCCCGRYWLQAFTFLQILQNKVNKDYCFKRYNHRLLCKLVY